MVKMLMVGVIGACCYWVISSTGQKQMAQMCLFLVMLICLQYFLEWVMPLIESIGNFFKNISDFLALFSK